MNIKRVVQKLAGPLTGKKKPRPCAEPATLHWQRLRAKGDPAWYQAYLRSHHWRQFRKRRIAQAKYQCGRCGRADKRQDKRRGSRLNVHHLTYERIGRELTGDVEVLCWICHKLEHARKG